MLLMPAAYSLFGKHIIRLRLIITHSNMHVVNQFFLEISSIDELVCKYQGVFDCERYENFRIQ